MSERKGVGSIWMGTYDKLCSYDFRNKRGKPAGRYNQRFENYISRRIRKEIGQSNIESRKEWILKLFLNAGIPCPVWGQDTLAITVTVNLNTLKPTFDYDTF